MRREHKKKLTINRRIIVNHLVDLEGVLDYLISKQMFTPAVRERIIYESRVPRDQIRHMLDHLVTRNALAYQYFLEALVLTDNSEIANTLEPGYPSSDECKRVLERERLPALANNARSRVLTAPAQSMSAENANLPYPVVCTQNHPVPDLFMPRPVQCLLAQSNGTPSNRISARYINRFSARNGPGLNHHSMSPILNRARSTSVTGERHLNGPICTSASSTGLIRMSASNMYETPSSSTTDLDDNQSDQSPSTSYSPPSVYNLNWCDVNRLELDFEVYRNLPNIRKQLSPDECYQMERKPRGLCLLINNEHFYDAHGTELNNLRRIGTDSDAQRLSNLFEKLYFHVEIYNDLRECEMHRVLRQFAQRCESNDCDAICLIILSHGTDGYVYGVDFENKLNLDKDVLNMFDEVLIGKPKLFIFQACRGEHLNQKDSISVRQTEPVIASVSYTSSSSSTTTATSSSSSSSPSTQPRTPIQVEEETTRKFKQLKISSIASGTLQLMYKKKTSNSSSGSTSSVSSTASTSANSSRSIKKNVRSRSHSRGKYSSYLASAATAIKSAIRTPSTSARSNSNSISTQTISTSNSSTQSPCSSTSSIAEQISNANCNIINCNSHLSVGSTSTSSNVATNFNNFIDGRPIKTCLPSRSDFFIWYSSVRGFVSHRDVDGSPFIKCLVTVFSRCSYELELIEMVRKVNMLMQQYEKKHFDERNSVASYFMVPVAEFHLTKRLYFNP